MEDKNIDPPYNRTIISCFLGIFVEAIVTNITAILFIPMMNMYNLSYIHLGMLVGINFVTQVMTDLIFSGLIDKLGYRKLVLPACFSAFIGLVMFGFTPVLFNDILMGLIISTIIFSAASGLLEIQLSSIVNAIPNDNTAGALSLMHSFYAWGQVATIIVTTLFIYFFGGENWQIIVILWAIVPFITLLMFMSSPFPDIIPDEHRLDFGDLILKPFYIIALAAIFFGAATECVMNQWASTFTEKALNMPKLIGDLCGMCVFAVMLGMGRSLYSKYSSRFNISRVLIASSLLALACYILTAISPPAVSLIACGICGIGASLLWPGTLIISADRYPMAGAWMFAILAAAGDIGAGFGPWVAGLIIDNSANSVLVSKIAAMLNIMQDQARIRAGILCASIFPVAALACHVVLLHMQRSKEESLDNDMAAIEYSEST